MHEHFQTIFFLVYHSVLKFALGEEKKKAQKQLNGYKKDPFPQRKRVFICKCG